MKKLLKNKRGELPPTTNNNPLGSIGDWMSENPIWLIIIFVIIIILALWSIQYITCRPGFAGTCLKVACFGKFGLC